MEEASYKEAPLTGCPVLEGASAFMEFNVVNIFDVGGDHDIVVGELINAVSLREGEVDDSLTLPYIGWSYAG
jgi:flavin reductase (DIM6/NTAB) family NADH-FMN oxidoreductase RutF